MSNRSAIKNKLLKAAKSQNLYDLNTINLIAPASPTPLKYFYEFPLHNAIAEGLLGKRPYAGAQAFNEIEKIAADLACNLFGAEHANVQPHSVSQANQAVYQALLENGDKVLAMEFHSGGHLTHGLKINFSGRFFDFSFYGVNSSGLIDYGSIEEKALQNKPKMILCGASSYPRKIDFAKLRKIADKVGAYLVADLSHPAGLIIAGKFPKPFPNCDVVTLTPDKTMLGPHGGIVLCKKDFAERIDRAVHPGVQSSIPLQRIFHTALALLECDSPFFKNYIKRVIENIKVFEKTFSSVKGLMVTGGSDTHLMVLDTFNTFGLKGVDAENVLESINILTNRQVIPGEKFKPYVASGIRLGTSWITARGYSKKETELIAKTILSVLKNPYDKKLLKNSKLLMADLIGKNRKNDVWKGEDKKYETSKNKFSNDIQKLIEDLSGADYLTNKYSYMGIKNLLILNGVFRADKSYLGNYMSDYLYKNRQIYKNKKILDLGCGCGILGIICAKFGAREVSFSDINPNAVKNSKANTVLEEINNSKFFSGDLFQNINTKYDLIIFNPPSITGVPKNISEYALIREDSVIDRFYKSYKKYLNKNGMVLIPGSTRFDGEYAPRNIVQKMNLNYKVLNKTYEENKIYKYILCLKQK